MKKINLSSFSKVEQFIPNIIEVVQSAVLSHKVKNETEPHHLDNETAYLLNFYEILQKKWIFNVMLVLINLDNAYFNEIKRNIKDISSRALSDCLKYLESKQLVNRIVEEVRPVRVNYCLTEHGKNIWMLLIPAGIYFGKKCSIKND